MKLSIDRWYNIFSILLIIFDYNHYESDTYLKINSLYHVYFLLSNLYENVKFLKRYWVRDYYRQDKIIYLIFAKNLFHIYSSYDFRIVLYSISRDRFIIKWKNIFWFISKWTSHLRIFIFHIYHFFVFNDMDFYRIYLLIMTRQKILRE